MTEPDQDHAILDLAAVTQADDLAEGYGPLREGGAFVSARPVGGQEYRAIIGYQAVRARETSPPSRGTSPRPSSRRCSASRETGPSWPRCRGG